MSVCVSPLVQVTSLMTDDSLPCPQCPKSFSSTKLLQQHQQMFHTDKAFICETCGKAFRFRSNLAEHRSVHTALKPYVCKFCGKSSRLKGNLTKHILKHHKKEQNEAIGKDDIIVKKAPKTVKENGSATTNGTSTSTPTTATAVITTTTPTILPNTHTINNNSNNVANNNHRTIKMEIEDPDYISMAVTKTSPPPTVTKVITSTPVSRPKTSPKEQTAVTTVTPVEVVVCPDEIPELGLLPKDASTEDDRSVLISLGFDYGSTLSLTRAQLQQVARELKAEMGGSPDTVLSDSDQEYGSDSPPLQINNHSTVGGEATLAAMIVAATSGRGDGSPDSTDTQRGNSPSRELSPGPSADSIESCPSPPNMTHCQECGKPIRKSSHLPIHMTLSHGYPPPSAAGIEEPPTEEMTPEEHLQHELRIIASAIHELKEQQMNAPRVEQALTYIDGRVERLERSLEIALNSIYTLVQLQTGMTSSVNRLREDSLKHFAELKARIDRSCSPRRNSRRSSRRSSRIENSIHSRSCSRDRSRSRSPL